MIPRSEILKFKGCEVRAEYITRNGSLLIRIGTVESIGLKNMYIATSTVSGNVYHVPLEKIRSVNDLNTGITVHNFIGRTGKVLKFQKKEVIE
jgi:hypothetical protein